MSKHFKLPFFAAGVNPFSKLTRMGLAFLPENQSLADKAGLSPMVSGKISDWNWSDYKMSIGRV
jgi:hypothetical protein